MTNRWSLRRLLGKDAATPRVQDAECQTVSSTELIEIGDFKIDTISRSATLRGEELKLTSEEFDVLVFLAGHPQRVVTPRTTLATSWAADQLHQTEFLKALLSLRKKLAAASSGKQYLRTEPWVVYRFDPNPSLVA
jgi:two-component system, OmpR family, KDP operon response regulator KdpE